MTDLEMTRLCAEAMGFQHRDDNGQLEILEQRRDRHEWRLYDPLKRDAQVMALLKRFDVSIRKIDPERWDAWIPLLPADGSSANLNRAIVQCVAEMQLTQQPTPHPVP